MRFMLLTILLAAGMFAACNRPEKLEEKIFVVNIKAGGDSLQTYLKHHEAVWPEVEEGFRKAGYKKIRMFRSQHTMVMVITVPAGADLDAMGKAAESSNPRCAEWNRLMAAYQQGVAGTLPGQTWTEAAPFYEFSNK